jgi:hypothetical protein
MAKIHVIYAIENQHEFLLSLRGKKVKKIYTDNKVLTIEFTDGTILTVQSDKIPERQPYLNLNWNCSSQNWIDK